ncbi:hypothetical protein HKW98_05175 [Stutzerimonas urumqiensis]|uniref:PA3371 family protein n=1 Tax=Stutzerimonas urumqiensis TaxID=638269 RepID=UPI000EAF53BA|nr:PA3371 family protein [Stutzerimonas urumqiensis]
MSKMAICFLTLTTACVLLVLAQPSDGWTAIGGVGAGIFGALSLLALIAGRRIKFDPVLR